MIKPTIGRVVWYWEDGRQKQPLPGLVCYVHSDTMVNLAIFDVNGVPKPCTSVFLYQGDSERPSVHFAEWMPYQKGQAAKTEQLEKQLAG
jgi:hypothetical protein